MSSEIAYLDIVVVNPDEPVGSSEVVCEFASRGCQWEQFAVLRVGGVPGQQYRHVARVPVRGTGERELVRVQLIGKVRTMVTTLVEHPPWPDTPAPGALFSATDVDELRKQLNREESDGPE